MADYLIKDTTLTEIANAIRNKAEKTDKIPVSNFAKEINELKAGGNPPTLDDTLPADASYVTGGSTVTLIDSNEAVAIIRESTGQNEDLNLIFGVSVDESLGDKMCVTVTFWSGFP